MNDLQCSAKTKVMRKFILSILTAMLLPSCGGVSSSGPVGNEPLKLANDQWEGHWTMHSPGFNPEPEHLRFEILDSEKGTARLHYTNKDTQKPDHHDVVLRTGSKGVYGSSLLFNNDSDKKTHLWLLLHVYKQGYVVAFLPKKSAFEELVKQKRISGEIVPNRPELKDLTDTDYNLLAAEDSGNLYWWMYPIYFIKDKK